MDVALLNTYTWHAEFFLSIHNLANLFDNDSEIAFRQILCVILCTIDKHFQCLQAGCIGMLLDSNEITVLSPVSCK